MGSVISKIAAALNSIVSGIANAIMLIFSAIASLFIWIFNALLCVVTFGHYGGCGAPRAKTSHGHGAGHV
ncbi:hypothetical protein LTS18_013572 [Coniosporium uncinatum]|uniref:Uncharacterized protein n=1 Tax=Coniosporium uncinatum TaxID=93489 RepID=A0ACC3DVZ6_9PEZI|nr:hypothetical protein LTS18_013572 [Coniosporium uncinatum]